MKIMIRNVLLKLKWVGEVFAFCTILTECVHLSETLNVKTGEKLSLKVTILKDGASRSGIDPQERVENGTATVLSNGYLYLTDANGSILLSKKIDKNAAYSEGNIISLEQLQTVGAIINDTPENAIYCYVALNLPVTDFDDSKMFLSSGNISSVEQMAVGTNSLYDENGGINNVPLWGKSSLVQSSNPNYGAEATVNMRMIASRIEISRIGTVQSHDILDENGRPYEISSFRIAGIFINNFFSKSQITGLVTPNSKVFNTDKSVFIGTEDAPNTPYSRYTELFSYSSSPSGLPHNSSDAPNVLTPALPGQSAWAYNIFPNDTSGMSTKDNIPHIIIRFSQITYRPVGSTGQGVTLNDQFVTVAGFLAGGAELQYLKKGRVYTFSNLSFSLDVISPYPETKMATIDVDVSVIPWIVEPIAPPVL
jgi:hypothetical protein